MLDYLEYLRGWVGAVGFIALFNVVQCFVSHEFLGKNVYTIASSTKVDALTGRLFGLWTLLTALIRIMFCIDYTNYCMYLLALSTFVVAFFHYLSEALFYGTANFTFGIVSPLIISGISIFLMAIGFYRMHQQNALNSKPDRDRVSKRDLDRYLNQTKMRSMAHGGGAFHRHDDKMD